MLNKSLGLALIVTFATAAAPARAQIIDRILAVVNGAIIMQSDVALATRLALVPSAAAPDPIAAALDALIQRRLMLEEVDRYAPPDPPEPEIDRHVADIRARAGGQFEIILQQSGFTIEQLRRQVRDDLRIDAYLLQRFGAIQPSEDEILQYYREHAGAFARNGVTPAFEDARDTVRAAVIADRRGAAIREWVGGLRRRANVTVLPR